MKIFLLVTFIYVGVAYGWSLTSSTCLRHNYLRSALGMSGGASPSSLTQSDRPQELCLDFDGVLCASADESSYSSILAAKAFWPKELSDIEIATGKSSRQGKDFLKLRNYISELRPVIETGYENMVLVRYVHDKMVDTASQGLGIEGIDIQKMIEEWCPSFRDLLMEKYGTNAQELIVAFGGMRDIIIADQLPFWVGLNKIYPSVSMTISNDILQKEKEKEEEDCDSSTSTSTAAAHSNAKVPQTMDMRGKKPNVLTEREREAMRYEQKMKLDYFICTSKQGRFVETILEGYNICPPPKHRLFDLENPAAGKPNVLLSLLRHMDASHTKEEYAAAVSTPLQEYDSIEKPSPFVHFVEDRYDTLLSVIDTPGLGPENVKLYLVDWGYTTPEHVQAARDNPRVEVLDFQSFSTLIRKFVKPMESVDRINRQLLDEGHTLESYTHTE